MAEMMPCPCSPMAMCRMDQPCLGCETYGEWLNRRRSERDWRTRLAADGEQSKSILSGMRCGIKFRAE